MPEKVPPQPSTVHSQQLPDAALELIADQFRALAEPMRLRLLSSLMQGEKNVSQLVESSGTGQANVSKHLAILKQAGMIATRREGLATMCSISDPAIFQLCGIMCTKLKGEHEARSMRLEGL